MSGTNEILATSRRAICVYCSSSSHLAPIYMEAARAMGQAVAESGYALIYGGTRIGLMGEVAKAARQYGAPVTGIVPEHIRARVPECEDVEALVVTPDMRNRKALMEERADAFVALPGGFGTLEEVMEVLTLKQLGQHTKPVVFLNTKGFYEPLLTFFEALYRERFARRDYAAMYRVVDSPASAIQAIEAEWASSVMPLSKWA
ncbi:MAG: TIGR00730 family Rossman fold protein [Bryobacterales bacterium]|nr:TIGR00730 family Rossman fold protein [Bryobacterales bacterium]